MYVWGISLFLRSTTTSEGRLEFMVLGQRYISCHYFLIIFLFTCYGSAITATFYCWDWLVSNVDSDIFALRSLHALSMYGRCLVRDRPSVGDTWNVQEHQEVDFFRNASGTEAVEACDIGGPLVFGPYDNAGDIAFGETMSLVKNPIVLNVTKAWRGVEMRVRVDEMERGSLLGSNSAKGPVIDNFTYFFNGRPSQSTLKLRLTGSTIANTR